MVLRLQRQMPEMPSRDRALRLGRSQRHCPSNGDKTGWMVLVSPPEAEHAPDYATTLFERKEEAKDFAEREEARLGREYEVT